ncbi:MAG TPA: metallophosphoesterase [Nitrososphaeraceae archaeon]|jgi:putative SbcD/Mre11-related phosphoesterase|nr:metallophosphoesterase [Nitrososphaeraceae archaeon]
MSQFNIVENKPALLIDIRIDNKAIKILVISDLHLGSTYWSQSNGISLDWYRITTEIESELKNIVISNKVDSIVLLGDIKNNIYKVVKDDWNLIPKLLHSLSAICQVYLIPGNHDSKIGLVTPENIHLMGVKGMVLGDILLTHGHTFPSELRSNINKIIMGHLHPTFFRENSVLNGQKVWIFLKVKKDVVFPSTKGSLEIVMLPSYSKYVYGNSRMRNRRINSPILKKILRKEIIEKCLIVSIDGTILGNESLLGEVFNTAL